MSTQAPTALSTWRCTTRQTTRASKRGSTVVVATTSKSASECRWKLLECSCSMRKMAENAGAQHVGIDVCCISVQLKTPWRVHTISVLKYLLAISSTLYQMYVYRMWVIPPSFFFFHLSINVFTLMCGRTGVDSVTSIDLRVGGTDGWRVEWVEIANDLETFTITCNSYLNDLERHRFHR